MFKFSIVVPCYNLEGLIRKCLISIINQSYSNYELIIVNDKSTDSSLRVIRDVSKNHTITILDLDENVGLGKARNIGLEHASGDYVIFIDGDDEIESELLHILNDKIERNPSDIIVYNHYREWVSGRKKSNIKTPLLESLSKLDNGFNDDENKIKLFSNFNVAWNKAYKRKFLINNNLKFTEGYYEDVPFNYAAILLSKSISVTEYIGYKYRQREGSILNSRSDKHKDIIHQYNYLFSVINNMDVSVDIKSEIYNIFIKHIYIILCKERMRLSHNAEKEILKGASSLIKLLPSFYKPNNMIKLKLNYISTVNSRINSLVFKVRKISGCMKYIRKVKVKLSMGIKLFIYRNVFIKLPLLSNTVVFESYWGRSYSCNPKAISEYLANNSNFNLIWFGKGNKSFNNDCIYAQIKTLKYFYYLARAKYLVNNANFPNFYIKKVGSVYLQTKHGTPLKVMGNDELRNKDRTMPHFNALARRCSNWDYVISSNPYSTEKWREGFPFSYEFIESGYPRNDYLYKFRNDDNKLNEIRENLGLYGDKKVILLCPTFREYHNIPNYYLDFDSLSNNLTDKYIILVRAHYLKNGISGLDIISGSNGIVDVTLYPNIEDLYLISDLMITDYSSSMFDYANLERPIVIYTPDYDEYQSKRGLYFDIRKSLSICSVSTQSDLENVINQNLFNNEVYIDQLNKFNEKFCSFDYGSSSEIICNKVFDISYMHDISVRPF